MGLGLFFIAVIAGYYTVTHRHSSMYRLYRVTGYHVFLESAFMGICLAAVPLVLSFLIYYVVNCDFPKLSSFVTSWYFYIPILASWVIAVIYTCYDNLSYDVKTAMINAMKEFNDWIGLILYFSVEKRQMVMISMKNNKVYIGLACQYKVSKYDQSDTAVAFVPVYSGYRTKKEQNLKITIDNYAPIYLESVKDKESINDDKDKTTVNNEPDYRYLTVIPKDQIVSIRMFNDEVYNEFKKGRVP